MDPEHCLVAKTIVHDALADVLQAGVSPRFFHDTMHGEVWDWINRFWERYSKTPDRATLLAEYPTYDLVEVPEPLDYYIDAVREAHRRFETFSVVAEASEALKQDDVNDAFTILHDGLIGLEQETSVTTDDEIISTWEHRMEEYALIEEGAGELKGIPTGFPSIDRATGGLQPEQFIVLIGLAKGGKSTVMMRMAIEANNAGYKVLFVSFEMSNAEQLARHDGMRGGFNYNKILQGRMTPDDKQSLRRSLRAIQNGPEMVFIHDMTSTTTLAALTAKAIQYKPDVLFVDGVYLMDSEIPGVEPSDTKSLTKLSRGLKRLAQRQNITVVASTQALEWKRPKSGLTAFSVGYTNAFSQDCDLMCAVEIPEVEGEYRTMRTVAGRNTARASWQIRFNWDEGRIEEAAMTETAQAGDDLD